MTAVLAAAGLTAGYGAVSGIESARQENFTGGSRTATVRSADFAFFKSSSLVLYEDGEARVKESRLRLHDNKADIIEARTTATNWVNAPEQPQRFDYPAPPF